MRVIWRDKKGRFASYHAVINGPFLPPGHPLTRKHMQRQTNRALSELLQSYMASSAFDRLVKFA